MLCKCWLQVAACMLPKHSGTVSPYSLTFSRSRSRSIKTLNRWCPHILKPVYMGSLITGEQITVVTLCFQTSHLYCCESASMASVRMGLWLHGAACCTFCERTWECEWQSVMSVSQWSSSKIRLDTSFERQTDTWTWWDTFSACNLLAIKSEQDTILDADLWIVIVIRIIPSISQMSLEQWALVSIPITHI